MMGIISVKIFDTKIIHAQAEVDFSCFVPPELNLVRDLLIIVFADINY